MRAIRVTIAVLLLIAVLQPRPSGAAIGGPVDGQVLEYDTGKPIAGAIVVGLWGGNMFAVVESFSVCIHAETAVTDGNGRYHFGPWIQSAPIIQGLLSLDAYKPGYESAHSPLNYVGRSDEGTWIVFHRDRPNEILQMFKDKESARAATYPDNVYMKPYMGSASDRFEYLSYRVFSGMNCRDAGESRRSLYPLLKAAYQEAKTIAATKEQQRALSFMRNSAKRAWLALPRNSTQPENPIFPEQVEQDLE